MHTGALLCERSIAGLEPLGAFNQPVHRIFAQIRMALLNDLGADCANYFSRPDIKRDGEWIGWFAQLPGEPRRWVDLTPEEQAELEPAKQDVRARLDEYVARLAATPDNSSSSNFSKVLAQALQVPSPDYLYFMNRQPVVAFWGFKNAGVPEGIEPLRLSVRRIAMPDRPTLEPAEPSRVSRDPARVSRELGNVLRPGQRWWRWLLGALLMALLLAAAWWWLLHRSVPVYVPGSPASLGAPSAILRQGSVGGMGTMTGPAVGSSVVVAVPSVGGAAPTAPALGGGSSTSSAPSGAPSPPNNAPSDFTAQRAGQPNVSGLPPSPGLGATPQAGKHLAIPPGTPPGPASFMEGLWRSRSGLQLDGRPAEEIYRFDHNGMGDVTVKNGAGGTLCHGSANAVVEGNGQLAIKEPSALQCSDGSVLPGAVTACSGSAAATVCGGTNQDGSRFNVKMVGVSQ